jgi:hypothetical protein
MFAHKSNLIFSSSAEEPLFKYNFKTSANHQKPLKSDLKDLPTLMARKEKVTYIS